MAQMGRPRTFDRDQAVEQAMLLFWQQGYESTSLSQLKASIAGGISAPSFYAAFGSKEALFHEAVQRYLGSHGQVTECLWDEQLAPRQAIELALRRSASMQCEAGHPKGCMVSLGVMCAPSAEFAAVVQPLTASRERTRAGLRHCVQRGIASGELSPDAQGLATVFDSFLLGIATLARDGADLGSIDAAISHVLQLWKPSV